MRKNNKQLCDMLYTALDLDRKVIGVKFIKKKENFDNLASRELIYKIPYCVMIKSAINGHDIKIQENNFGCDGAKRALGFMTPPEDYYSGKASFDLGLYKDIETAANVNSNLVIVKERAYGMRLAPLEKYKDNPDVVIIITNSFNAMRIMEGHNYAFGLNTMFSINGNQAICEELTAFPYIKNRINISFMCSGTRQNCGWKVDELGVAIPYNIFPDVLNGIVKTINPLERDDNKSIIDEKMKKNNLLDIEIEYGKNYDTGRYTFGRDK